MQRIVVVVNGLRSEDSSVRMRQQKLCPSRILTTVRVVGDVMLSIHAVLRLPRASGLLPSLDSDPSFLGCGRSMPAFFAQLQHAGSFPFLLFLKPFICHLGPSDRPI